MSPGSDRKGETKPTEDRAAAGAMKTWVVVLVAAAVLALLGVFLFVGAGG